MRLDNGIRSYVEPPHLSLLFFSVVKERDERRTKKTHCRANLLTQFVVCPSRKCLDAGEGLFIQGIGLILPSIEPDRLSVIAWLLLVYRSPFCMNVIINNFMKRLLGYNRLYSTEEAGWADETFRQTPKRCTSLTHEHIGNVYHLRRKIYYWNN